MEPNYEKYSLDELYDALSHIDKAAYPEREKRIQDNIKKRQQSACSQQLHTSIEPYVITPSPYQDEKQTSNWIAKYWKGQFSLPISYWLVGIAINLFILAFGALVENRIEHANSRLSLGVFMLSLYAVILPLITWQTVGIYRSANRHPYRGGSMLWANVAKAIIIISTIGYIINISTTGIPVLKESYSLITQHQEYPELHFRLLNNETELELYGGIEVGSEKQLEAQLDAHPNIKLLHLHSIGGRMLGAIRLAGIVKQRKLDTYVKERCASACTVVYLAGVNRLIGENGELAFHAAGIGGTSTHNNEALSSSLKTQYINAGVPQWFLEKVLATPNEDLWIPDHNDLRKAKIITQVVNSAEYGFSGFGSDENISEEAIEQGLLTHNYMKAMKKFDSETYEKVIAINRQVVKEGGTMNRVSVAINQLLQTRINHYLAHASDEAVLYYWQTIIAQMVALRTHSPLACASFAFPSDIPLQHHYGNEGTLPSALIEQELDAMADLIGSFSPKPALLSDEDKQNYINRVVKNMKQENADYFEVIQAPADYLSDPEILCLASISLNKHFVAFKPEVSSALLRTINTL